MKTKYPTTFVLVRVMACVMGISSASTRAAELRLEATTVNLTVGRLTTVDLYVSNYASEANAIAAIDFALRYDTALLAAEGVIFGPYLGGPHDQFANFILSPTVSAFAISFLDEPTLDALQPDSFLAASVTFRGLAAGAASITLDPSHPNLLLGAEDDPESFRPNLAGAPVSVLVSPSARAVPEGGSSVVMLGASLLAGAPLLARPRAGSIGRTRA